MLTAREDEFPRIAEHPYMASKCGLVVASKSLTQWPVVPRVVPPETLPGPEIALALPGASKVEDLVICIKFNRVSMLVILGTEDNVRFVK